MPVFVVDEAELVVHVFAREAEFVLLDVYKRQVKNRGELDSWIENYVETPLPGQARSHAACFFLDRPGRTCLLYTSRCV